MSSDGTYSTIADFSKVDEIMQDLMFKTCTDYDCSKLFEDLILQNFLVMSYVSGAVPAVGRF